MKQHKAQKKKKFMAKLDHINTITVLSLVTSSAKPLINLLFSLFLSFLRHLLSSLTTTKPPRKSAARDDVVAAADDAVLRHSSISRALSQTLYMVTEVPVSSRKYDPVRSLAEQIVENNSRRVNDSYRCDVLRDVNRYGLSEAFVRTLSRLERLVLERRGGDTCPGGLGDGKVVGWVVRAVRSVGEGVVDRLGGSSWGWGEEDEEVSRLDGGEKLAAELLWLADMMAACGVGAEAVRKWGEASELASVAHLAEPRLQSILVKITALLIKHAKELKTEETPNKKSSAQQQQQLQQSRKNMLVSWLPFLCQACNGAEAPALPTSEKIQVEKVIEESIETLLGEEEQEQVLSLWLHHFFSNPHSDWPNLQGCYARWCDRARNQYIARQPAKYNKL
ncbi:hypothetical protein Scep_002395 [Stephania cephalantha]|uniref:Uncharacterized protein n=1 Tax=Stephania cephalantha TaxID=152367 RepID=A0AAP0LDW4_9MAGN